MPKAPNYPLKTIEEARSLYRDGVRVRDIAEKTGMSVGALYYHLDGHSLPGLVPPRLPRRREVFGNAVTPLPSRGRQKLAARLFRAAERQARKIEFTLALGFQRKEDRALDLAGAARAHPHPARPRDSGGCLRARRTFAGAWRGRRQRRAGGCGGGPGGDFEPDEDGVRG